MLLRYDDIRPSTRVALAVLLGCVCSTVVLSVVGCDALMLASAGDKAALLRNVM